MAAAPNPESEARYRTLKLENPTVARYIARCPGAVDFLVAAGFAQVPVGPDKDNSGQPPSEQPPAARLVLPSSFDRKRVACGQRCLRDEAQRRVRWLCPEQVCETGLGRKHFLYLGKGFAFKP